LIGVRVGARAAGCNADQTQNGVAAIAQAMRGLGGQPYIAGDGAAGGGDGAAGGFDGDGDGGGGAITPPDVEAAPLQTLRIGGKVVTVAPRIRLIPLTPPPRVVPPPPIVVDEDLRAAAPGTRAKAPAVAPPDVRNTRARRGGGAFNQACVLLFFHTKGKYFLFVKLGRDFVIG